MTAAPFPALTVPQLGVLISETTALLDGTNKAISHFKAEQIESGLGQILTNISKSNAVRGETLLGLESFLIKIIDPSKTSFDADAVKPEQEAAIRSAALNVFVERYQVAPTIHHQRVSVSQVVYGIVLPYLSKAPSVIITAEGQRQEHRNDALCQAFVSTLAQKNLVGHEVLVAVLKNIDKTSPHSDSDGRPLPEHWARTMAKAVIQKAIDATRPPALGSGGTEPARAPA